MPAKPPALSGPAESTTPEQRDVIDISEAARRLGGLTSEEAEARAAHVRALREQLDAGLYQVDPKGVAQKMMERGEL